MIDIAVARLELADLIAQGIGDLASVYPGGAEAPVSFPAVMIGMPGAEFNTEPCIDTLSWPIAVAVARSGSNDPYVINELDHLWPLVVEVISDAIDLDQTLGGTCKAATVLRAEPGYVTVQGADVPSQTITLETYG